MLKTFHVNYKTEYGDAVLIEMRESTEAPVERIAGECGYDALCSFNRNFKEITGTTPSCFRNGKA